MTEAVNLLARSLCICQSIFRVTHFCENEEFLQQNCHISSTLFLYFMVLSCFNENLFVLGYNAVPVGKWLLMFIGT